LRRSPREKKHGGGSLSRSPRGRRHRRGVLRGSSGMGGQRTSVEGAGDVVRALLEVDPQADVEQGDQDQGYGEPVDPPSREWILRRGFLFPTRGRGPLNRTDRRARFDTGLQVRPLLRTRFFRFRRRPGHATGTSTGLLPGFVPLPPGQTLTCAGKAGAGGTPPPESQDSPSGKLVLQVPGSQSLQSGKGRARLVRKVGPPPDRGVPA